MLRLECRHHPFHDNRHILFNFVRPYSQNPPSHLHQSGIRLSIPRHVIVKLFLPKRPVRDRNLSMNQAAVPKTSIHEHRQTFPRKNRIRFSRQFDMQPITRAPRP